MLEVVTRELPPHPASSVDRLQTAEVLVGLADSVGNPPDADERRHLDALCRKLQVARRVDDAYTPSWGKLPEATPLPAGFWPLLIVCLLARAESGPEADEDARGLALKLLNAGLVALDQAERVSGVAHTLELRAWADELVAGIPAAAVA